MVKIPKIEYAQYVSLALRRKGWIIIPFLIAVLGGLGFLKVTPKMYRATTLILLEPQSIPEAFVRSTVVESMEGRLRTITQQITSRTNLESVIQEFKLDQSASNSLVDKVLKTIGNRFAFTSRNEPNLGQPQPGDRTVMARLVDDVRKNLQVNLRGGGGGGREQNMAFEISFDWYDQDIVAPVTNSIATRFINENLNAREEMAVSTTDFLDKETATIRGELEAREKELEAFKRDHMGMLPDQLESNLNILNQLREQLRNVVTRHEQDRQQALLLRSQSELAHAERNATSTTGTPQPGATPGTRREAQMTAEQFTSGTLEDLEAELSRLTSLYTEKHPDIVALKRRIEALRAGEGRSGRGGTPAAGRSARDPLAPQIAALNASVESSRREIQDIEKQIQLYQQRVERVPQVEMELNKIIRDYQTVRQRYDNLLSRKLDAKMAEQMERRKKGEQFRVLDPAVKPPKPYKPNPLKIMLMAIAAGLGLGGGLAYLREAMDPHFYGPEEVEAYLSAPVIMCIPLAAGELPSRSREAH